MSNISSSARIIVERIQPVDGVPRFCVYGVIIGVDDHRVTSRMVCDLPEVHADRVLSLMLFDGVGEVIGDLRHARRETVMASLGEIEVARSIVGEGQGQ